MKKNSPRNRYIEQKENAVSRHIPFSITFEEWWKIWQESGHWQERGCKSNQYVMTRFNDQGPYAVGNVKIITWAQNIRERKVSKKAYEAWSKRAKTLSKAPEIRKKISKAKQGEGNAAAKLTDSLVLKIRAEYLPIHGRMKTLAKKFGVSGATISMVVNRKIWKHI